MLTLPLGTSAATIGFGFLLALDTPPLDLRSSPLLVPIAHALVATAVGLVAAIPAVMAFNFFSARLRVLSTEMDNFSADFLNMVKRHV